MTDEAVRSDGGSIVEEDIFSRTSDVATPSRRARLRRFFERNIYAPMLVAWDDSRTRIGALLILFYVFLGTIGVRFVGEARAFDGPIFSVPLQSMQYPLGTDYMGRSILAMTVHGTPAMLKIVAAGALFSVIVGTLIGTIAGYTGGAVDKILMSLTDVVLTLPGLLVIILLAAIFPPKSPYMVGLLLGIDNWPGLSRTIRSQVLSIREEAFTEASRIMGMPLRHILRKDVITNLMPYISINFATSSRRIIFESVGLYFLGILPFTNTNWGVMMNAAYQQGDVTSLGQLHWLYVPMFTIITFSLGFILFAQGLDRVFNVRLQARMIQSDDKEKAPNQ